MLAIDRGEQLRQAASVDLHGDHVDVWLGLCHRDGGSPCATTDLKDKRGVAAEPGPGVQLLGLVLRYGDAAELGPEPFPGPLLRGRQL